MGQAHRIFHRQTQPTHHLLNLHPTPTSVISTPSNVEGPRSCAEMERPLHCSLPPHPKPCHLDRRRAFAPQWRDPRIGSPSLRQNLVGIKQNPTQPCHLDPEQRRRTALCAAAERPSNCFSSNPPQIRHPERSQRTCHASDAVTLPKPFNHRSGLLPLHLLLLLLLHLLSPEGASYTSERRSPCTGYWGGPGVSV